MLVLVAGCGGAATTSTSLEAQTTTLAATSGSATTEVEATASTAGGPTTTIADDSSTGAIPADCAAGFAEYLQAIEPLVVVFDPATSILGDFYAVDGAASDKAFELLDANGGSATYSCSEVGLEFAYFSAQSPWDGILVIAQDQAPGTVAYLEAMKEISAIDESQMSDFGGATCDEAVAQIKQAFVDQTGAGNETLAHMTFDEGVALMGLYQTYSTAVGEGTCPPDVLGNDEWGFMQEYLPNG